MTASQHLKPLIAVIRAEIKTNLRTIFGKHLWIVYIIACFILLILGATLAGVIFVNPPTTAEKVSEIFRAGLPITAFFWLCGLLALFGNLGTLFWAKQKMRRYCLAPVSPGFLFTALVLPPTLMCLLLPLFMVLLLAIAAFRFNWVIGIETLFNGCLVLVWALWLSLLAVLKFEKYRYAKGKPTVYNGITNLGVSLLGITTLIGTLKIVVPESLWVQLNTAILPFRVLSIWIIYSLIKNLRTFFDQAGATVSLKPKHPPQWGKIAVLRRLWEEGVGFNVMLGTLVSALLGLFPVTRGLALFLIVLFTITPLQTLLAFERKQPNRLRLAPCARRYQTRLWLQSSLYNLPLVAVYLFYFRESLVSMVLGVAVLAGIHSSSLIKSNLARWLVFGLLSVLLFKVST